MEVSVRAAELRDAGRIAAIHVAAWEGTYRGFLPDDVIDARGLATRERQWRERLADPPAGSAVVVVEADGAVRGFAAGGPSEFDDEDSEKIINMGIFYIDLDYRGMGVAAALQDGFFRRAAELGYELASGQTHRDNEASQRFFLGTGWEIDGFERVVAGQVEQRGKHALPRLD